MAQWGREQSNLVSVLQRVYFDRVSDIDTGRTDRRCCKQGDTNFAVCSLINFFFAVDILCVLRLARKVQPASVSVTVGGTRASFPWVNHFRNRNVVQYTRAVNTPVSNPWFYLTPGDANTIPGTLSCILTCSLVSEKINYILVKPVANHYRYFWTVKKKKKKKRLVFGYKLPLVRLVPPKVLQKNYLLQNLHLKSA